MLEPNFSKVNVSYELYSARILNPGLKLFIAADETIHRDCILYYSI